MTHPCGDPIISADVDRHEQNCVRCEAILNAPWTPELEATMQASKHPIITHPKAATT